MESTRGVSGGRTEKYYVNIQKKGRRLETPLRVYGPVEKSGVFRWFFELEPGQRPVHERLYILEEVVQFLVVLCGFEDVVDIFLDCYRVQVEADSCSLPERDWIAVFVADAGDDCLNVLFHLSGHFWSQ